MGVGRLRQHADIRTSAEHARLVGRNNHGTGFRVFEPQALHGVVKFYINAEIVGIELQLIAREKARVLVDIEGKTRNTSVNRQFPVVVFVGTGPKVDPRFAAAVFSKESVDI